MSLGLYPLVFATSFTGFCLACRLPLQTLNPPLEPRHIPTRVAIFTTPAGARVRSVAGGQTYSAVATVDGRVFKWGLNRPAGRSHGSEHSRDVEGGESRGSNPREENEEAAMEASVPRQVAGVGMEASDCQLLCIWVGNKMFGG